jgi:hypothetical protein
MTPMRSLMTAETPLPGQNRFGATPMMSGGMLRFGQRPSGLNDDTISESSQTPMKEGMSIDQSM